MMHDLCGREELPLSAQRTQGWTRRRFLGGLTLAGAVGLLGRPTRPVAAEPPPETTRLRLKKDPSLCEAPLAVAEELLQGEGFSEVQFVRVPVAAMFDQLAAGEIDLGIQAIPHAMRRLEAGDPLVFLAGVHVGCFELFGHAHVRAIRDLKGKVVVVPTHGGNSHTLVAIMAAYVGLDPQQDITWVAQSGREAMQFFIDGKADAFMGFPPQPQELRARQIGQVVVSTTLDRPWSQYFCCLLMANRAFVRKHPIATKRAVRALLKATDVCALAPETTARQMVARGWADTYDVALSVIQEMPYAQWRERDAEDTVRFFALRMREAGIIKSTPQQIMARGTDWRFLTELKKELKG
jgi:NitT/TauT family transport system substrate-binding protein